MLSVHDNSIVSYEVRCDSQSIVFHTVSEDRSTLRDVEFTNVLAYYFMCDLMKQGNIIFDISQDDESRFIDETWNDLVALKNYGWPGLIDYNNKDDLLEKFKTLMLKTFIIGSSMGLSGYVLAQSMRIVEVQ